MRDSCHEVLSLEGQFSLLSTRSIDPIHPLMYRQALQSMPRFVESTVTGTSSMPSTLLTLAAVNRPISLWPPSKNIFAGRHTPLRTSIHEQQQSWFRLKYTKAVLPLAV